MNCLFGISHGRHLVGTLALELAGVLVGQLRPPIKHRCRLLGLHAKTRRREKHGVLLFEARQAGIYISLERLRMNCSSNNAGNVHGSNPRHLDKTMQSHDHIVSAREAKHIAMTCGHTSKWMVFPWNWKGFNSILYCDMFHVSQFPILGMRMLGCSLAWGVAGAV